MPNSANPFETEAVRERVTKALLEFVDEQVPRLVTISEELEPLATVLVRFISGGKRLRPVLAWWGWRAAGGANDDAMIRAAASLELLQACALIHDDVMDGSDTRRGAPSVHRSHEDLHAANQWNGCAETFGIASAILLGDLCLSWTDQLLFESGLEPGSLLRAKPLFDATRTELMAGQYLDVVEQARAQITPERALRVARYKSAKYTIERPLHLGAVLAGGPQELIEALSNYGLPLGEAFQLRDDVLGVFGDPNKTGKPAGDDLREGKQTYLVAAALETATQEQRGLLLDSLGRADLSTADIERLRELIVATGALDRTEALIATSATAALASLEDVELHNNAREALEALAVAATKRSH